MKLECVSRIKADQYILVGNLIERVRRVDRTHFRYSTILEFYNREKKRCPDNQLFTVFSSHKEALRYVNAAMSRYDS